MMHSVLWQEYQTNPPFNAPQVCSALLSGGADSSIRDHAGKLPQELDENISSWDIWPVVQ